MALGTATVSFDVAAILGTDFDARRTKCWVTTNVPNDTLIDTDVGLIRLGSDTVPIGDGGTGSATVWCPGEDGNPASWQTYFHFDYPRTAQRDRAVRTFGPYTITESADLADLEDEQAIPPNYQTAFTEAAQAYLDAQAEIAGIDDTDSAVAGLIENELVGPLTNAALAISTEAKVTEDLDDDASDISGGVDGRILRSAITVGQTKVDVSAHADDIVAAIAAGPTAGAYYLNKPLYQPSAPIETTNGMVIEGPGHVACTIKLPNGADHDLIRTPNFDSMVDTNKWKIADGVVHGVTLSGFTLDGNKANNDDGRGLAMYVKRLQIKDVMVVNTAGDGVHTEAGTGGGQDSHGDMPESAVRQLWIYRAGKSGSGAVGFRNRGPHDGYLDQVYIDQSEGDNMSVEASANYQGASDMGYVHLYASQTGRGFYSNTTVSVDKMISESNYEGAVDLADGADGSDFGRLKTFGNFIGHAASHDADQATDIHVNIAAGCADVQIDRLNILAEHGGTALWVGGPDAQIYGKIKGAGSGGRGAVIDESNFQGFLNIKGFSGTGGVGLKHSHTTGRAFCQYVARITDCKTCLTSGFPGINNQLAFTLLANAGQVADTSNLTGTDNEVTITSSGAGTGLTKKKEIGFDVYRAGSKILGTRKTGWSAPTGTRSRAAFDPSTVTTADLAQRVAALLDDLGSTSGHGLIN